jgi:S-adenosylmethionine hydrolase
MGIITLTTDLGYRDPYLAIVKARLFTAAPRAQVIDLSCGIKENNISDAAFALKNSLPHFPKDTIHLVAVKFIPDRSSSSATDSVDNSRYLLTYYHEQYVLSPDTGLFSLIDASFNAPVYQVYYEGSGKNHFFMKDVFVDVAAQLSDGKRMDELGVLTTDYYKAFQFDSYVSGNILRGKGVYVDDFGNIITNISAERFNEVIGKKKFTITLPGARISRIYNTYDEVKYGSPLVIFNSFGLLEVAINGKSAYDMLCPRDIGRSFDFNLLIEFND